MQKMRLTPEEMADWRSDPVTRKVRQYLKDYRQDLMETWANGGVADELNAHARGLAQAAQDFEGIDYRTISDFYGINQENEETNEEYVGH